MGQTGAQKLTIRTARGLLLAENRDGQIWVNMGAPVLDWHSIPLAHACDTLHLPLPGDPAGVGMGNPHCVFFVADADTAPVAEHGAQVEHDPLFPEATNVEFASVVAPDHLRLRVWERGTGITLACGSGACATRNRRPFARPDRAASDHHRRWRRADGRLARGWRLADRARRHGFHPATLAAGFGA